VANSVENVVYGVVVNDHTLAAASGVPPVSCAFTVAVYVLPTPSAADGVNVTVRVGSSYEVAPPTATLLLSRTVNVMVLGLTGFENVTVGSTARSTPVAPASGVVVSTVGADPVPPSTNITST
jgi:hypothetical protein